MDKYTYVDGFTPYVYLLKTSDTHVKYAALNKVISLDKNEIFPQFCTAETTKTTNLDSSPLYAIS